MKFSSEAKRKFLSGSFGKVYTEDMLDKWKGGTAKQEYLYQNLNCSKLKLEIRWTNK